MFYIENILEEKKGKEDENIMLKLRTKEEYNKDQEDSENADYSDNLKHQIFDLKQNSDMELVKLNKSKTKNDYSDTQKESESSKY